MRPIVFRVVVADLKCYLCGTVVGSVEYEPGPRGRPLVWRRADAPQASVMFDCRDLRCSRCGGSVYIDDTQIVTRRIEPSTKPV
jgi:hypothetical protein